MKKLSTGQARESFAELVNEAAYAGHRTVVTRHGKPVAAIVSIADLDALTSLRMNNAGATTAVFSATSIGDEMPQEGDAQDYRDFVD